MGGGESAGGCGDCVCMCGSGVMYIVMCVVIGRSSIIIIIILITILGCVDGWRIVV